MNIQKNISLKPFNTFGIDESAEYFTELVNEEMLKEISTLPHEKKVLGGGSNILLTQPVSGLVIQNKLKGISVVKEDNDYVWVKVAAGENWHNLVMYAIDYDWAGIENLALIPGTVGASPMQNIGAYGVEVKDCIESVTAWHWQEQQFETYTNRECRFGYRDSIFKHELKGKVFVTAVTYRFNKVPQYNVSYGAIDQELQKSDINELSIKAIANAVIAIRRSKLPDPIIIGNAGSFFKNPTIPTLQFQQLKDTYANMPSYAVNEQMVKIPAGWLIEQAGWKGYKKDNYGVHAKQALVLVNYGNANGTDIKSLANEVVKDIANRFGITLEQEVQTW
jgi:UDP-N-acetylmuramate dehydrogenase